VPATLRGPERIPFWPPSLVVGALLVVWVVWKG
jgi:hypothetical protein